MSDNPNKRKKRKNPSNSSSNTSERNGNKNNSIPRKKNPNLEDTIAKSKQLSKRLQCTRTTRSKTSSNKEPRVCGNGKPMPSLAELELMFADSDDDGGLSNNSVQERCVTPVQIPNTITEEKLMSPRTLKEITTKMMDMISNPPTVQPPIVQQKRKKSDIPYIVGCTERPQVPWQPKRSFCKGDEDYGVGENAAQSGDEENSCPKKRRRSDKYKISNSIFNAKSDEIAARLKGSDEDTLCSVSPGSNDTVAYDYTDNSPTRNIPRSFSPLPSTSRDNDTILKNDKRFTESMLIDDEIIPKAENLLTESMQCESLSNDVEVIENYETIVIDDTIPERVIPTYKPYSDDDSCVIIESDIPNTSNISPIKIDSSKYESYSTIDLCQNFDDDILEVIDIDDIIAENKALIEKYSKESNLDSVTFVEPTASFAPKQQEETKEESPLRDIDVVTLSPNRASASKFYDLTNVVMDAHHPPTSRPVETFTTSSDQQTAENSETISDLVLNFFSEPADSRCTIVETESVVQKITSWLSSLQSICGNSRASQRRTHTEHQMNQPSIPHFSGQSNNNVPTTHNVQVTQHSVCAPVTNCLSASASSCVHARVTPAAIPNNTPPKQTDVPRGLGDCPICMDNLSNNAIASTLCGHIFCLNCIKESIKASGKKCPTCRKTLKVSQKPEVLAQVRPEDTERHEPWSNETHNELYSELVLLEQRALVPNAEPFECGVCMEECAVGQGVVLRECVHTFCTECLANLVRLCVEPTASCPATGCPGTLHEREVRAVVSPEEYEKWLARGLATAESGIRSAFHCRTRDCPGWALCDPDVQKFPCPVCKGINCLPCQAIHEGETCEEYKAKQKAAANPQYHQSEKATREMLDNMIKKGKAMRCPECSAVIFKALGCDWLMCSACKTEICWATRGRRWGPRGRGDISGGCRCKVNRKRCHPKCRDCH